MPDAASSRRSTSRQLLRQQAGFACLFKATARGRLFGRATERQTPFAGWPKRPQGSFVSLRLVISAATHATPGEGVPPFSRLHCANEALIDEYWGSRWLPLWP